MKRARRKHRWLYWFPAGLILFAAGVALILYGLRDNLLYFYTPTDLRARAEPRDDTVRLGGLVAKGSLVRARDKITFTVTDGSQDMVVSYVGILPNLFREGQGVIAEGRLGPDGTFTAMTILAKHDENYMPRELVEALKKSGQWQDGPVDTARGAGTGAAPNGTP